MIPGEVENKKKLDIKDIKEVAELNPDAKLSDLLIEVFSSVTREDIKDIIHGLDGKEWDEKIIDAVKMDLAGEHPEVLDLTGEDLREFLESKNTLVANILVNLFEHSSALLRTHHKNVELIIHMCGLHANEFNPIDWRSLGISAKLHDLGKMAMRVKTLYKKREFDDTENDEKKNHPSDGAELLHKLGFSEKVCLITKEHQEKYNGTGYPDGKEKDQISVEGRLLKAADVYCALLERRPGDPVREPWTKEKVFEGMKEWAGKCFDPKLLETFLKIAEENSFENHISVLDEKDLTLD